MTDRAITPEQLATLSHEFRTPLNGVLGMARLLDGTSLTAEQRAYVAALKESGDHLLSLINDVLDLARLGEGRVELHPAPMSVENLLRQVAELMSPRAHEKGLELAWASRLPADRVMADEGRLRQVLLNFAGNAVKFTEAGGVTLLAEPGEGGAVRFVVRDTGPGVPAASRERIFQPFIHADSLHGGASVGGAGLGLAIVRRLGAAMDGRSGVDDAPAGGSDFWFEAPLAAVEDEPAPRPLEGRRLVVASRSAIVREATCRQVEALGGTAIAVASLAGALGRAAEADAMLIDHPLVAERGARAPAGQPAIVLLRPDERDRIEAARAAGFAGYLIKPLRQASLAARVLAALSPTPVIETAQGDDDRVAPAVATGVRVLLAEDNPINALLARTLLEREGCLVDRAASGEETLAAMEAGAYDLILMDVRMPGLTGLEATRRLRERGVATPIVALTADAFEDDRRACLAAGMDDFLVKPLTPAGLRAVLARWGRWTGPAAQAKLAV